MSLEISEKNKIEDSISRYKFFDILRNEEGVEFIETWRDLDIPITDEDSFHEISAKEENRIDLIAYQYYQNSKLWWVLVVANDIRDPLTLEVGKVLRIPSINSLYGYGGVLS